MLSIFQVSFEESFRKFQGNFMKILYKMYENLRSIEKIKKKKKFKILDEFSYNI